MSDLAVQASLSPVPGELRWQLSLEFALVDGSNGQDPRLVMSDHYVPAPADAVRRLLSVADWQG